MDLSKKLLLVLFSLSFATPLPLLTLERAYAQTPNIYLDPTPLILNQIGASGTVGVKLANVSESAGFELKLSFDNTIVRVDSITLLVPTSGVIPVKSIDNERGTATFGAAALCEGGVCPNILSGSPLELAEVAISAVGEGTTGLEINASYTLYGVEMGADDTPVKIEATLTNGRVEVGGGSSEGPTIELSSGGNTVVWPSGLEETTSLSALESIETDCGSAKAVSRRKNGWWESAVYDYGGANFGLVAGGSYYIKATSSCSWTP